MVDGILILGRQILANKFNEYFASIATKLNNVENPEHEITLPETFEQFMHPSNGDSVFFPECTEQEVAEIIPNPYSCFNCTIQ